MVCKIGIQPEKGLQKAVAQNTKKIPIHRYMNKYLFLHSCGPMS